MSRIIRCAQGSDLSGVRHSMLTFVRHVDEKSSDGRSMSEWRCDCGNIKAIATGRVTSGVRISCGCYKPKPNLSHGMKGTPTYSSWHSMKVRCETTTNKDYLRYGARGIKVCERWKTFEYFLEDMGIKPAGTSIDRFPNRNGSYEPGNCRWATPKEQEHNKDGFVVLDTPLGVMPLIEYASKIGLTVGAAHMRLKRGKLEGCAKCLAA